MRASSREDTSATILDAAYRCLAREGYAAVSMRQIAREAGVALSQLHYYFQSKERLFIEVMRRTTEQHLQEVVSWLGQLSADQRLNGLVRMVRAKLREDPGWFRLLFDFSSLAFHDAEVRRQLRRLFEEVADEAASRFAGLWQAPSAGTLRSRLAGLSPQTLGRIFVATLYGLALQVLMETDETGKTEQPVWFEELLVAVGTS
ncbi:MAG: TetR family transcriptional regulator [Limnochordaceae bacterium]|uniref:TetR/AcrR family transcriptional regulator n=1 Tax=Carboxydichorda subterranea TaxID=3109565 RepID=A0ABZ1BUT5_9FIRM|nr:TetR/AcrR family transcriptional regulator [Limnochorda sp. L945t]MBE3597479.1 TetR family transcriptional regulator [Limnochordaceae bacterium]WRP16532.1 TetR/AcrR family transcriptional regulator [Limnochorda sp. L945t]